MMFLGISVAHVYTVWYHFQNGNEWKYLWYIKMLLVSDAVWLFLIDPSTAIWFGVESKTQLLQPVKYVFCGNG